MKWTRGFAWLLAAVLATNCVSPAGAVLNDAWARQEESVSAQTSSSEVVSLMVELESPSVFGSGLEMDTAEADILTKTLMWEQDRVLDEIRALTGLGGLAAEYRYTALINGFAISVHEYFLEEIERLDGVLKVCRTEFYGAPEGVEAPAMTTEQPLSAAGMIGVETAWASGYDGSGMVVAVIDTGLDLDHPAFADDLNKDELGLTRREVADSLEYLNAFQRYDGLSVEDIYRNNKIPFAFNYADNVLDVGHTGDTEGDHGTHVAGIVAANDLDGAGMAGIAPEAQLVIMKVFGQAEEEGVFESVLLAALEDAVRLGCDVINMSFGAAHGFSEEERPLLEKAIEAAVDRGVVFCAAAGNDFQSAHGNISGTNLPQRGQIDIGTINAPASMIGVLSIGSFEASGYYTQAFWAEDEEGNSVSVQYADDGLGYGLDPFSSLERGENTAYDYVVVPGIGSREDVAQTDLSGAVALIARGGIPFAEKAETALDAGAVGVIIYHNSDESITMDLSALTGLYNAPCVLISREDGARLVELAGEDGRGVLRVSQNPVLAGVEGGGEPSGYSGWGVLSDLTLKPDLCGVGGLVYSTLDEGEYGTMSGTSMASPQVAGAMALVLEYVRERCGLEGRQASRLAETLLMNTAHPAVQKNGACYSPRKQGAGLVNAAEAVSAQTYLTVDGSDLPKAELGDDPLKRGQYQLSFTLHNISDTVQRFVPETVIMTEAEQNGCMLLQSRTVDARVTYTVKENGCCYLYDFDGNGRVELRDAERFRVLLKEDGDFPAEWFDLDGSGLVDEGDAVCLEASLRAASRETELERIIVNVPAGGSLGVTVLVQLSEAERARLNTAFEYGIYVDGYVTLSGFEADHPDLSFPLLAFYGDWSKAPLFETFSLPELMSAEGSAAEGNNPYPMRVVTGINRSLGSNPGIEEGEYIPERSNALNTSGGDGGTISDLYLDLLRNGAHITVEMLNARGQVLCASHAANVQKSMYVNGSDGMMPVIWSEISTDFEEFVPGDYGLADGDRFTIRVSGKKAAQGAYRTESFTIPAYIDGTAPRVYSVQVSRGTDLSRGCQLTVTARDNFYVACVALVAADGETVLERFAVDQRSRSAKVQLTIDVTKYLALTGGEFTVEVVDYANNLTVYDVSVLRDGDGTFLPVDSLLAYGTYFGRQGWYKQVGESAQSGLELAFLNESMDVCAAEQVGGYLFTVERYEANQLNVIDTGTYRIIHQIPLSMLVKHDKVVDLAYVDEEQMLYILACVDGVYCLLRVDLHRESMEWVTEIDSALIRGLQGVYALSDWEGGTLAVIAGTRTEEGEAERAQLYVLNEDLTISCVCDLDLELNTATMSAEYDRECGTLFFSCYDRSYPDGSGLPLEVSGIYCLVVGSQSPELVLDCDAAVLNALVWTGETETKFDPEDPLTQIVLSGEKVHLLKGQSITLTVTDCKPWYAGRDGWQMSCVSDNISAAAVQRIGKVTASGEGTAEITVTLSRYGYGSVSAVCTVIVEPTPLVYALKECGLWTTFSTVGWSGEPAEHGIDRAVVLAAYALGAGRNGEDVIYALDGGTPGEENAAMYTLYTVTADSWETVEVRALTLGRGVAAELLPTDGFAGFAYDPSTGYLAAVSGDRCFMIDPITAVICEMVSLAEACGTAGLLGVTFSSDGTAWFLDGEGNLYETCGCLSGFAAKRSVPVLGRPSPRGRSAALVWDQLRDVLWIAWGEAVYRVENLTPWRSGSLGEPILCWFMKYYG